MWVRGVVALTAACGLMLTGCNSQEKNQELLDSIRLPAGYEVAPDGPEALSSAVETERATRTWRIPADGDVCADAYAALDAVADGEVRRNEDGDCRITYYDDDQHTRFTTEDDYLLAEVYTYDAPTFG